MKRKDRDFKKEENSKEKKRRLNDNPYVETPPSEDIKMGKKLAEIKEEQERISSVENSRNPKQTMVDEEEEEGCQVDVKNKFAVVKRSYGEEGDNLIIGEEGSGVRIGFCKTLRIPEDGKIYPLPPNMGLFPLKKIEDYKDSVPSEWLEEGGVFFPMYQREAMWICLENSSYKDGKKKALKIGIGNLNIVSGEKWTNFLKNEGEGKQDYVVIPDQPWVDGIAAGDGYIKQFIAMPIQEGYTVEEQVIEGKAKGGLQFLCFHAKESESEIEERRRKEYYVHNPPPKDSFRLSVRTMGLKFNVYIRENDSISKLYDEIQKVGSFNREDVRLYFDGELLHKGLVKDHGIEKNDTIDAFIVQYGGGGPLAPDREMGIASGGKIKQKIYADKNGLDFWDTTTSSKVVVRIVNTKMYERITGGEKVPESTISAKSYTENNLPWFDIYDEDSHGYVGKSETLSNAKSVKCVDEVKGLNMNNNNNNTVPISGNQVVTYLKKK